MISLHAVRNRRRLALFALVCGFAALPGSARAAEVAPQISLANGIIGASVTAPSLDDGGFDAFGCFVAAQDADGNFSCDDGITGRIVGVTSSFGFVVGHRVRMTRQVSATVTESYDAAVARTGDDVPHIWMAGSLVRTTRTQSCNAGRCITLTRTTGPLPFTAEVFSIGG
jgi:hypothetical protein